MKKTNEQILAKVNTLLNELPNPKSYQEGILAQEQQITQKGVKFLKTYIKMVKSNKKTFKSYDLNAYEFNTIKKLLKERNYSVTYISYEIGFISNKAKYRIHVWIEDSWN